MNEEPVNLGLWQGGLPRTGCTCMFAASYLGLGSGLFSGFRVENLGSRVGFRVQGLGFRVQGLGFRGLRL